MTTKAPFISVNLTPAMSGYFATLYTWSEEHGGFYEPYDTGLGRYATWAEANVEGERWAQDIGVEFHPATQERVDQAEAYRKESNARMLRVKALRDQGLSLKEAIDQGKREGWWPS